ncbi:MAG: YiiX/YebB-like N1pC/P60 family cysteine hydrolase [Spirulinaceae cyanobacterium]
MILSACKNPIESKPPLTINSDLIASGDIIFRQGNSLLSRTVISVDENASFSHVGLVEIIKDSPYVIHASTGEPFGKNAKVKIETLEAFLAKEETTAIALYRVREQYQSTVEQAVLFAHSYASKKLPFDQEFNLETEDSLYCTELVWRAYLQAGLDLVEGEFENLDLPLAQGNYLLPSNLLNSKYTKKVYFLQLKD